MIHGDLLGERARLTPDKTALIMAPGGQRLSYGELNLRAEACAAAWRATGLRPGDRIGILAHNRVEYVEAFFAAMKSGVILVTLGTRLTPVELEHIVRDSGMKELLYGDAFSETVQVLRAAVDLERWTSLDEPADRPEPPIRLTERCDPESTCCLLYTSGTTGKPKGVMIPHRMVAWNGLNTACGWQLRESDVSPIFTPLYHAGGLMAFLTPMFAIGGTIVLHAGFDVSEIWRTIAEENCTVVLGVPTIWKMLMDAPEFGEADLSRVRWFISGGAPLPEYIIKAYQDKGVVFKQGFGMTEVGVNCFAMTVEDSYRKAGSIGKPMMFTEVRLAGDDGAEVPVGEIGEMWFRGPHVSLGYWNDPQATAAALDGDGWFHSGDLARRDEDGFFYIAGRMKDMIISGGVNVYPAEIEAALLQHPLVEDAAVVGVPDPKWGEAGIAFVTTLEGRAVSVGELVAHLETRLARFKVPKQFRFVPQMPRTAYGKVVKAELVARFLAEEG